MQCLKKFTLAGLGRASENQDLPKSGAATAVPEFGGVVSSVVGTRMATKEWVWWHGICSEGALSQTFDPFYIGHSATPFKVGIYYTRRAQIKGLSFTCEIS